MGTEVNLFRVELNEPASFDELANILQELGFVKAQLKFDKEQNYELSTKKGITEIQITNAPSKIKMFFLRFSFGNPPFIIDQTIEVLKKLTEKLLIKIFDSENAKPIKFNDLYLTELKRLLLLRKEFFDIHQAKIDAPMRGGKETFDYIKKYKKGCESEKCTPVRDTSTKTAFIITENTNNEIMRAVLNKIGKGTIKKFDWVLFDVCSLSSLADIKKIRTVESTVKNINRLSGEQLFDVVGNVKIDWGVFLALKKNTKLLFKSKQGPCYLDSYSLQNNSAEVEIRLYGGRILVFARDENLINSLKIKSKVSTGEGEV